jgi:hypothetical protein
MRVVNKLSRALEQLADHEGVISGAKLGDSRLLFADDVLTQLLINATGGTEEAVEKVMTAFGEAVAAFARFAHVATESYLLRHEGALRREP